jgi:hypothetical protein
MSRIRAFLAMVVVGAGVATAEHWWYAYEATTYPEEAGWGRFVAEGGALRSLEDGALIIDSRASTSIYDEYLMYMPSPPGPGEVFLLEFGLRVDEVIGFADPCMSMSFAPSAEATLWFKAHQIYSLLECCCIADYTPGVFHDYALTTSDLQTYALFVDGQMVHEGALFSVCSTSTVLWGDCVIGSASLSAWDYVRFGVVPAPQLGDVNCDATVDFRDINPFVQALTDQNDYKNMYPGCWPENADINGDGSVDFGDINPFIEVLTS